LISASAEFPICTASGDQLYPDVCWDGSAFWVVWQDDEQGTIRGVRVNEDGELITDEVEFFDKGSYQGPLCQAVVATGTDRISAEARVKLYYNEFGSPTWGIMHNEFFFDGNPIHPYPMVLGTPYYDKEAIHASTPCLVFGEKYFFSFHRYSKETPIDFHASSVAWSFDPEEGKAYPVWESSEPQLEFYPPVACWDGDRYVVLYWDESELEQKGVFFLDSIYYKDTGEDFSLGFLIMAYPPNDLQGTIKYQALTAGGSGYFFISERGGWYSALRHQMVFHLLDSSVIPLDDSGSVIDFAENIDCFYPDAVFNGEAFVSVWENRYQEGGIDLYSIEVDTLGNVLDSGYIVEGADTAQHPAMIRGPFKILMVWADNRDGNFNIYGSFLDAVGIEEPAASPATHPPTIAVDQTVFTDVLKINLSAAAAGGTVIIHDALGRVVKRIELEGRSYSCVWDGRDSRGNDAGEGVYFVSLAGKTKSVRLKVIKIK